MSNELTALEALKSIAAIPLWGEKLIGNARKEAIDVGEYDKGDDSYNPSCDAESSYLREAVETARATLAKLGAPRYAVETKMMNTWENCWSDNDGKPLLFYTHKEAQEAIREHIIDCENAVADGDMMDAPTADDLRIVEVMPHAK